MRGATRDLVFLRPGTLVIRDAVSTAKAGYEVTWLAHAFARPEAEGTHFTVKRGGSRVDIETLLPRAAAAGIVGEPSDAPDHPYLTNKTYAPSFRIEVRAAKGAVDHRFLHVIQADALASPPRPVALVEGEGMEGAAIGEGAGRVVVIFSDASRSTVRYAAPRDGEHVILGLRPHESYAVEAEPVQSGWRVSLGPGAGRATDEGGTLLMRMDDCAPR